VSGDLFVRAWHVAQVQGERLISDTGPGFPHVTEGGRWRRLMAEISGRWSEQGWSHGNWTAGFSMGFLWRLYEHTGDARWADAVASRLPELEPRAGDLNTHDIGFLFWPSFGLGAELTGDAHLRAVGLRAARTLASRLQPGGYLAAWGPLEDRRARESSTIDTMMNLPLLWWSGDAALREVARAHALTASRTYFRPDGSTYHRLRFDPDTGTVLDRGTFQGMSAGSCWSRGQAWAIAGFGRAWRETCDSALWAAANRAADYFLTRLGERAVPPWDFADTDPRAPLDSSAAVIAAHGLMDLERYGEARRLLSSALATCLNVGDDDGLLLHACYSRPHNEGVDSAVIWGDYFTLACLGRVSDSPASPRRSVMI